ncbi:MAG: 50S ribosomal protein L15 [Proteobacteria bacterium]|nr:50S ribosomal protein L15 [Pseudomonadota bacterium]
MTQQAANLGNLRPARGSHRAIKRLGRGPGSGTGKTSGKGQTGQKARKSGGVRPGFEGGQTPLYRRVPKRGFSGESPKLTPITVSLSDLNVFAAGDTVTPDTIVEKNIVKNHRRRKIKLLNNGELSHALTVEVHKCSKGAKLAIEQAGGSVTLINEK